MPKDYVVFRKGVQGEFAFLDMPKSGIQERVAEVAGCENPSWTVVTASSEQAALEMAPGVLARDEMMAGTGKSSAMQPV